MFYADPVVRLCDVVFVLCYVVDVSRVGALDVFDAHWRAMMTPATKPAPPTSSEEESPDGTQYTTPHTHNNIHTHTHVLIHTWTDAHVKKDKDGMAWPTEDPDSSPFLCDRSCSY